MLNIIYMLLTVLVPVALVVLGVAYFTGRNAGVRNSLASVFELDTEHGLIKQGLLWLAIGLPLALGVAFGIWAWSGHSVELSATGYKKFIEISILPLAIMSISLPMAGLVSRFHSTQQAAKQISITLLKNNLDSFAAHRKGMLEYFSSLDEMVYFDELKFQYKTHPVLHKRFFLGSPERGWPSRNENSFDSVEQRLQAAAKFLIPVLEGSSKARLNDYLYASLNIYLVAEALHIKEITHDMARRGVYYKWSEGDGGATTLGVRTLETLAALRFTREFYGNLCDFSGRPRLKLEKELEDVFYKTDYWLKKGEYIEAIHSSELATLVEQGKAEYGEKHIKNMEGEKLV
ncbi:hypothetical protein PS683_01245 [Pseudomonas fluorescens]|uniref:Uncharacterized protein n=1 Tax=Pseudomonas fluorescens TaxID=294 RepID=A0A5E6MP86_PSEFL|nr:hypothetical protein PS683_01245 [Pseudomonas fluorescens]VVM60080.1 hypothetical protein PS683_01245 [Pseudomonas fluorescens]